MLCGLFCSCGGEVEGELGGEGRGSRTGEQKPLICRQRGGGDAVVAWVGLGQL